MSIEVRFASEDSINEHKNNTENPHAVTKQQVGLENVANELQYSEKNPPPYPVTSVNGKTGAVELDSETWTFTLNDGTVVTKQVVVK